MRENSDVAAHRLYAHSANEHGDRHLLADHLRNVAMLARERAEMFDGGELIGCLHLCPTAKDLL